MKIKTGSIELELEEVKKYPRFTLYQVYKIVGDKKIALYKTCYTDSQIQEIINHEEVFE